MVAVFDLIVLVGFLRFRHQNLDELTGIVVGCLVVVVVPTKQMQHVND